jgi:hypothetical protein
MRKILLLWTIFALGLLVTLLSGFYRSDFTKGDSIDTRYGLPFSWHGELKTADSPNPTAWFMWENFVYDAAAWSFVFGFLTLLFTKRR